MKLNYVDVLNISKEYTPLHMRRAKRISDLSDINWVFKRERENDSLLWFLINHPPKPQPHLESAPVFSVVRLFWRNPNRFKGRISFNFEIGIR